MLAGFFHFAAGIGGGDLPGLIAAGKPFLLIRIFFPLFEITLSRGFGLGAQWQDFVGAGLVFAPQTGFVLQQAAHFGFFERLVTPDQLAAQRAGAPRVAAAVHRLRAVDLRQIHLPDFGGFGRYPRFVFGNRGAAAGRQLRGIGCAVTLLQNGTQQPLNRWLRLSATGCRCERKGQNKNCA